MEEDEWSERREGERMRGVRGGRDFGDAEGVLFLLFIYLFIGKGKKKRKSWQRRERGVWRACERG